MYTLLLRLAAPLQSWGYMSLYDNRATEDMPTKSGVIGLLAAALGRRRDESLEDLQKLQFGVRVDLKGTKIDDFQIADMGVGLNANLSHREYLSDAIFLVGLASEDKKFLEELMYALNNPVFTLFLGRKSCPPTLPLVLKITQKDLYSALKEEEWLVPKNRQKSLFNYYNDKLELRIVMDAKDGVGMKKDVPISFVTYNRQYGYRTIKEKEPTIIENHNEQRLSDTRHDVMSELE